jgi:4-hydroxy-tetrahydrodipicolinate synthase
MKFVAAGPGAGVSHNPAMIKPGVYPAAVTPFDEKGRIDMPAGARLLSYFEAEGCTGAVLAGTNGEGPSLSAPEKRDLAVGATAVKGKLDTVLGVATPSLDEAVWLCKQADQAGCVAVLLMPPFYFRDAPESGIEAWFAAVMDKSPSPIIIYNFPQKTGVTLSADLIGKFSAHERFAGAKDSSGYADNVATYKAAVGPNQVLFTGDETLLFKALKAGWSGSISGAANVLPQWISQVVADFLGGKPGQAEAKFELILPAIEAIRKQVQPATSKALLRRLGVLPSERMRLPLEPAADAEVDILAGFLSSALGLQFAV